MKAIAQKVWREPAAAIGLLVTLLLLAGALLSDHVDWSVEHILAILAPLLTGLGIRQAVTPTHRESGGDAQASTPTG